MSKKTQGTELYFIDPANSGSVVKVGCVTGWQNSGGSRSETDDTCLEDDDMKFKPGMKDPGTKNFGLNFDPSNPVHVRIFNIFNDASIENLKWALGWSDGTGVDPTLGSDGDFNLPTTRTWLTMEGYLSEVPFDFSQNSVVKSSISVRLSGPRVLIPKEPASE